jgi:ketosteroid isomerase-like protein
MRQVWEASNRGDPYAFLSVCAADAIYESENLGTRLEGVAAIRGFFEDWIGSYEELETVNEQFLDLGNGVTFSVSLSKGRPIGSTGYVPFRFAVVSVWAEGKIKRFRRTPTSTRPVQPPHGSPKSGGRRCRRRGHDDRSVITHDE